VRYQFPLPASKAIPYVLAGFGVASVTYDSTFTVGGTDVTTNLAQFGAILGTDVSGSFTKPMLVFGGGFAVPVWQQVVVDLQFRFGRIMAEDQAINVTRAGLGLAYRF
jgi:opacity protein-like surface antigen